jgi:hypothetical protein
MIRMMSKAAIAPTGLTTLPRFLPTIPPKADSLLWYRMVF